MLCHILYDPLPSESIISFFAVLVALTTILILLKTRSSNVARYMILVESLAAIWALAYGMEFTTASFELKVLWSKISYLGIAFLPLIYFLFTTAFSQKRETINPSKVALLSILPFLTILLVFTNHAHHLIWAEVTMDSRLNMLLYRYGPMFWTFWIYSILLILGGLYNLYHTLHKFTAYYKSQIRVLLIATLVPFLGNVLYVTHLNPVPGFDWTPVLFIFTGLVVTFGIFRYKMFDLVPFARNELIETMHDGVLVINSEGFIVDCNQAATTIFNTDHRFMIRKHYAEIFKSHHSLTDEIKKNRNGLIEIATENSTGTSNYQVRISPVCSMDLKLSGHLILINDITSLKKTENELKDANQQLTDEVTKRDQLIDDLDSFAHTVAHDLRSSLGSLYAAGGMIRETIQSGEQEPLDDMAGLIMDTAQKAMHITHELLLLATVSHQEIEKRPLDMALVFKNSVSQIRSLIHQHHAEIYEPAQWPAAEGYAAWVEEIWVNLLTNAIKYGGDPPQITVGGESLEKRVRFWVKDNGNGIPPEEQGKLFQKRVRLDPEKAEGYGLGLTIIKRIVAKLDGSVGMESSGEPGAGSLFWFELPTSNLETDSFEKITVQDHIPIREIFTASGYHFHRFWKIHPVTDRYQIFSKADRKITDHPIPVSNRGRCNAPASVVLKHPIHKKIWTKTSQPRRAPRVQRSSMELNQPMISTQCHHIQGHIR